MKNRYGSISGRAIKPIGLRVVAELRDAGIRLPIIATAGIRDFDDCREFFWAGADAVSLGSAVWLAPDAALRPRPARGAAHPAAHRQGGGRSRQARRGARSRTVAAPG